MTRHEHILVWIIIAICSLFIAIGLAVGDLWAESAFGATASSTQIVELHRTTPVHSSPNGKVTGAVSEYTPLTHSHTILPVITARTDGWVLVRLPRRPDRSTGWISTISTTISTTPWHVYVSR